jgi:hypothetical protein
MTANTPVRTANPIASTTSDVSTPTIYGARTLVSAGARAVNSIVPYASYTAQRLGALGITGLALWGFSAALLMSANLPLREHVVAATATLEELGTRRPDATAVPTLAEPQAQLTRLLHSLPTRADLPNVVTRIVAASTAAGISLDAGSYELVPAGKAGHIASYRLSFPVVGTYPQVRAFVDRALVEVPAMSLDRLSLERGDVADQSIRAELQFAVFVRTGS